MSEVQVALFPIPGSVCFPFKKKHLHVFEPRYRKMIQDCLQDQRLLGVAHTRRVISEARISPQEPIEKQLQSNQKTYEPFSVFSAGPVELLETLPDGRLLVEIDMQDRYQKISELQQVPYRIALCSVYEDQDFVLPQSLRQSMDQVLKTLAEDQAPSLKDLFVSPEWGQQTDLQYSFRVFDFIEGTPDFLQQILETTSPTARVAVLKELLDEALEES